MNGKVFNVLGAKIRGKIKLPVGKRIICFSPHPDDDVISMGGILRKFVENDNDITVAYMTSGNIAVFDHDVRRYVDFLERLGRRRRIDRRRTRAIRSPTRSHDCLDAKTPGEVDIPEVQDIKRIIREAEAVSGIESVGLPRSAARFLNLPFYQTGKVRKDPDRARPTWRSSAQLLEELKPEIDLRRRRPVRSARHAPHVQGSDRRARWSEVYGGADRPTARPQVWLYRGAWQEWPITKPRVLVPLSQEELRLKIQAIFKHQSQKDSAPFPGG